MSMEDAARDGDVGTLRELLRHQEADRASALNAAAYHDHPECVTALLEAGVNVNAAEEISGMFPLSAAAQNGESRLC